MTNVLNAINLSKNYIQGDKKILILENINLSIQMGEVIGLLGPSGSGKSTLLNIMGMLDNPSSGEIHIDNINTSKLSLDEKTKLRGKKLGFVFQFHHLLQDFTALENVMLPQIINGQNKDDAKKISIGILESIGLKHRLNHLPSMLSGGEQQRVSIARAISTKPSLIIADEPTGNLDKKTALITFNLLLDMAKEFKTAVFFATHDVTLISNIDRRFTIEKNNLLQL